MKFVCDNCKAKYQIGDDKVAGKTVRMKCRKCGYNIKVTPDAAAMGTPSPEAALDAAPEAATPLANVAVSQAIAPEPVAPAPAAQAGLATPAARAAWNEIDDESTSIMNAPMRDAVAALAAQRAPQTPAGRPAPAPAPARPVTATTTAQHPPRPVTATAAPRPYNPPGRTIPGAAGAPAPARPVTRSSNASMAAVQHDHTPPPATHAASELEWYVGIGGTPIGPVRVSVIRERAAAHEVDGESLVWREGLSEWRPLRTVPELLEVVTAAQAPRAAPTPTPFAAVAALSAPIAPASAPRPAPIATAPRPTPAPIAAAPTPAPVAAAPAPTPAPLAAAPAPTPAPLAAAPAPTPAPAPAPLLVGDPFTPPAASPFGAGPLGTPQNGKVNGIHHANGIDAALHAPAAAPVPADAPPEAARAPKPPAVDVDAALEERLVPRRGNTHPMAYAFIAAAAVFGGVAAYVLLIKPPPQKEIVYVPAPGTSATAKPAGSADDKGEPQVEVGDPVTVPSGRPVARLGGPMPKSTTTAAATGTPSPIDTSGFISPVPGPAATAPSGPAGGGGQLSPGEIQGVVSQNQAMVKRKCWQPALEARSSTASMTARVNGSITIGASGAVESASASGAERDYPGLSSCIAARMKNWKFPASGGSTPVNVPFVFAGQ